MEILFTDSAAKAIRGLDGTVKAAVGEFLSEKAQKYVKDHLPVQIPGVTGSYWVVRPEDDPRQPTYVIATLPPEDGGEEKLVVVSAIVPDEPAPTAAPKDPADIDLGLQILRSVKVVS